jgi:hypothetical protein
MSTPSNPFGSTSAPGEQAHDARSDPGETAGEAGGNVDWSAPRPGMADVSEIQTDVLPARQWDKSDVLTDKLPPRPRDIAEVGTSQLPSRPPDMAELETGRLPERPPAVSQPHTPVSVTVPAPVSVPAPTAVPTAAPMPARTSPPARLMVEISELPTAKLVVPPRPRARGRPRAEAEAERRERDLDDLDDLDDSAALPAVRRSRRTWWMIGIAVALGALVLSASGLVAFAATQGPAAVIQTYCGDLLAKDYASAYELFSPHARGRLTKEQFERAETIYVRLDGTATGCAITDSLPLVGNMGALNPFASSATISATLRRRRAQTGAVTLVRQGGGAWAIERIDPALEGADVAPLGVADTFCAALIADDIHSAYGLFSDAARHRVSEAELTHAVKDALSDGGNAKLTSCTPDPTTYAVNGVTARVRAEIGTSSGGVPLTLPITLTFVKAHGGWTIDTFDVTP